MHKEERFGYATDCITESLLLLLKNKPWEEITSYDLCEFSVVSGVDRATFNRYYKSKEHTLEDYLQKIFSKWHVTCTAGLNCSDPEVLSSLFSHIEENREFYLLLSKQHLTYFLKDLILDFCYFRPDRPQKEAYSTACTAYTLYGWIEVWLQRGMQESSGEIARMYTEL